MIISSTIPELNSFDKDVTLARETCLARVQFSSVQLIFERPGLFGVGFMAMELQCPQDSQFSELASLAFQDC